MAYQFISIKIYLTLSTSLVKLFVMIVSVKMTPNDYLINIVSPLSSKLRSSRYT